MRVNTFAGHSSSPAYHVTATAEHLKAAKREKQYPKFRGLIESELGCDGESFRRVNSAPDFLMTEGEKCKPSISK